MGPLRQSIRDCSTERIYRIYRPLREAVVRKISAYGCEKIFQCNSLLSSTASVLIRHVPIQVLEAGICPGKRFLLTSQDDHGIFNLIILIKMIKLNYRMRLLKCAIMTIEVFGRSS